MSWSGTSKWQSCPVPQFPHGNWVDNKSFEKTSESSHCEELSGAVFGLCPSCRDWGAEQSSSLTLTGQKRAGSELRTSEGRGGGNG